MVWREEQADVYAREAPGLPDFAPRGCQKGACYSDLMHAPDRIVHPLERVGPRGSGRWRRVSWQDALTRVADAVIDACAAGGPDTVVYDNGTSNVDAGPGLTGEVRLFSLIGATLLDGFGGTGDLAWDRATWDLVRRRRRRRWARADALLFRTQSHDDPHPDAHFAAGALRGATVVTPPAFAEARCTRRARCIRQGSDSALALGFARALLKRRHRRVSETNRYPFLVHRLLPFPAPRLTSRYGTVAGRVSVVPFKPDGSPPTSAHVEAITGVRAPGVQERLAQLFAGSARADRLVVLEQDHRRPAQRALILLSALRRSAAALNQASLRRAPFDGSGALLGAVSSAPGKVLPSAPRRAMGGRDRESGPAWLFWTHLHSFSIHGLDAVGPIADAADRHYRHAHIPRAMDRGWAPCDRRGSASRTRDQQRDAAAGRCRRWSSACWPKLG
jgi:hypothetical protein